MARSKQNQTSKTEDQPQKQPETPVWDRALAVVLDAEGGYVNDPRDPGGETNYGISKRAYPDEDIKNLTVERAGEIYRTDYWDACHCDELPAPVAVVVFDGAVNQGRKPTVRLLQKALGSVGHKVSVDGVIGPETLGAAGKADAHALAEHLLSWRARRYSRTNGAEHYLRGWMRRLFHVHALVLEVGNG